MDRETAEDARNAVIAHMASKNDEDHKGIGYQKALQMLDISDVSETEPVSPDASGDISDTTETTVTDGGPQAPPTPDVDVQDDDGDDGPTTADDLPDRYVPVDEYIETVRERAGHLVDVDKLADQLSDKDVVDVEETTAEHIAAYSIDEVADGR
jgi:hypothetical protein